jgi:CheY-like chemotaxis protein
MSARRNNPTLVANALITIVDDDDALRTAVARMLRSFGFTNVAVFPTAEHFLQSDRLSSTTCLVLDMQMPGMSGLELQERLAQAGHHIPIVLITASLDPGKRERAMAGGAVAYLHKPFTDSILLNAVGAALRIGGQHITGAEDDRLRAGDDLGLDFPVDTGIAVNGLMSKPLGQLRDCIAQEDNIGTLTQLVLEINKLLVVIETRVAAIQRSDQRDHD